MLFSDSTLNVFTKGNIFDLNETNKGLIFSNFCHFSIDYIANSNINTLDWKMIGNKKGIAFIFANDSNDRGENKLVIDIQSIKQLFSIMFD